MKIVRLVDQSFGQIELEEFFKHKVIDTAKRRLSAVETGGPTRQSASKHRKGSSKKFTFNDDDLLDSEIKPVEPHSEGILENENTEVLEFIGAHDANEPKQNRKAMGMDADEIFISALKSEQTTVSQTLIDESTILVTNSSLPELILQANEAVSQRFAVNSTFC